MSPDEDTTNLQCESQLALIGHSEVPNTTNTQMCLGAEMNCQNHIGLEMDNADAYLPCIVDMDIEKGNSGAPKTNDEAVDKLKIEGPLPVSSNFIYVCIPNLLILESKRSTISQCGVLTALDA